MKYELTDDAKARLERVAQLIEEEPLRINMVSWNNVFSYERPSCNTVGCVAGWIVADEVLQRWRKENPPDSFPPENMLGDRGWSIADEASDLLGLHTGSMYGVNELFSVPDWPNKFRHQHEPSCIPNDCWQLRGNPKPQTAKYAAVVAERIRHFIATGE